MVSIIINLFGKNNLTPKCTIVDGVSTPHPDLAAWFRQDRLPFGTIIGALSPSIVPLITNVSSSLDASTILSNTYANPSRGHIKQLQHRLKQSVKTHDQTITDYMQDFKVTVDELSILDKKMDVEDITDAVLNGLDPITYKTIIDSIHARDTPISFNELHEKLINHELSLLQQSPPITNLHQPATAFVVKKRPPNKPWNNRNQTSSSAILSAPTRTTRQFLGKCQFCFTKGHSLTSCYAFKNKHPQISLPPLPKTSYQTAQANVMTTTYPDNNQTWMFDSGASHHITNDLNTLSLHALYDL